jgi:hypothetical protein
MRVGQKCVQSVPARIETESVGAGLRSNRFQSPHLVGFEHLDQPGLADSYVEVPPFLVEEDYIGNAGKLSLRQLRA